MSRRRPHAHLYRPLAAQPLPAWGGVALAAAMGVHGTTAILFRCDDPQGPDCWQALTILGRWTLHDLTSPAARTAGFLDSVLTAPGMPS